VNRVTTFLREHTKEYEIPAPNIEFIKTHINKLQKKLTPTLEKNIQGLLYCLILPSWKTMFDIDNFIDTDKTLEEQKEIIQDLIQSVQTTGKITDKYIPTHLVEIVNRDFLVSDLKRRVLIAELNAELKLCDPEIDWIDAVAERMRIMHFSGTLIIELSAIHTLLGSLSDMMKDSFIPTEVRMIGSKYLTSAKQYISYYFPQLEIKPEHPVEGWIRKIYDEVDIVALMKQLPLTRKFPDIPNRNITISDVVIPIAQMCGGVAIGDDYMDLEEDLRNNKVTGVTQAVKQGIPAKHVLSTACIYSQGIVEEHSFATETQRWFIELLGILYHDQPECLRLCSEASPLIYKNLFQRK
jgi:hypothetical protein